jgi:PAS domain S-box-containing protein
MNMLRNWRFCVAKSLLILILIFPIAGKADPSFMEAFNKHISIMLLIDPTNGKIVEANPAANRFYGYSPGKLRTMSIQQINQLSAKQVAEERKLAKTEGRNFFIFRHQLFDEAIRTVEVHSVPLQFDGRTLLHSIIRDISKERGIEQDLWHYQTRLEELVDSQTKRIKQTSRQTIIFLSLAAFALILLVIYLLNTLRKRQMAEADLTISEQRYRTILDNLVDTYYRTDLEGRIVMASPSATALLGMPVEEIMGQQLANFYYDPDDRTKFIETLTNSGGEVSGYAIRLRHSNGEEIWVSTSSHFYHDDEGNILGVEGTARDITDGKRVETELLEAKELAEKANKAKSEFLASMSHDLRTPLNAIMGFSDMMRQKAFGDLGNKKYEEYADDIHGSGSLLISLINDVLDLSKIEAGKYVLAEESVSISALIDVSCRQLRAMAGLSNHTLTTDVCAEMPHLRGDERALVQILNNLVSNAIKFTPKGGEVKVSAKLSNNNAIVLSVKDSGVGMSEEGIIKALEPFEQADGSHTRRHEGTGLGLHLCLNFMKMFGGNMGIDSKEGEGTVVTLHFPPERTI